MLTIGRLATKAGVSADSIRFYERMGLIDATTRTRSGYRLYGDDAIRRLSFIKHAKRCGFSLPEIRALLEARADGSLAAAREIAITKAQQLQESIAALGAMLPLPEQ